MNQNELNEISKSHKKFMAFIMAWTNKEEGTWENQAIKVQAVPMLKLMIELVMKHRDKLDNIAEQKIINLISEATGLPAAQISDQAHNSALLLLNAD